MSKTPEEILAIMQAAKSKPDTGLGVHPSERGTIENQLLREMKRTNILLLQLKNIFLGLPLGPNHQQEAGEA